MTYRLLLAVLSVTSHSIHGLLSSFLHQAIHQSGIAQAPKKHILLAQDKAVGVSTPREAQCFLPDFPACVRLCEVRLSESVHFPSLLPSRTWYRLIAVSVWYPTLSQEVWITSPVPHGQPCAWVAGIWWGTTPASALLTCCFINIQGRREIKGMGNVRKLSCEILSKLSPQQMP